MKYVLSKLHKNTGETNFEFVESTVKLSVSFSIRKNMKVISNMFKNSTNYFDNL